MLFVQRHILNQIGPDSLRRDGCVGLEELVEKLTVGNQDSHHAQFKQCTVIRRVGPLEHSQETIHPKLQGPTTVSDDDGEVIEDGEDDDDNADDAEWEDVSDDDEDGEDDDDNLDMDDDDDMYRDYEEEVARMGWKVSPLGELIFPDGRIIGHRGLRRYYKQRLSQHKETSVAVTAARQAAGERLYRGRVYNIGYNGSAGVRNDERSETSLALALVGIAPGTAEGRAGKGILVTTSSGTYSQVSVYRYCAAVRKQRRQLRQGQQLVQRSTTNINRMDKKANRLMNNVSVAHAQR